MSAVPGLPARRAAAEMLSGVLGDRRMLSDLSGDANGPLAGLGGPVRARAQTLATEVLRHLPTLDAALGDFLQKPPPLGVMNALRIAAFELLIDGIAPHAAVNGAVELVAGNRKIQHLKALTNAVARKVAEHGVDAFASARKPELPAWMKRRVTRAYGAPAAAAIARAHSVPPPLDLTPKDAADAKTLAEETGGTVLPTGSIRLNRPGQVSALPGYQDGRWWVQDAAAALPVKLLGHQLGGLRVLDVCAAPGGKTLQLAAAGADVTAIDISELRLKRVEENLQRTGLTATVVAADALEWEPDDPFDIVLLDAPCSATGTLRRHPDLPYTRPDPDLRPLLTLQSRLFDRCLGWLKPGGRLVYCTCSLLPLEGEDQVADALKRRPDLVRDVHRPDGTDPAWWTEQGDLRTRPDFWPDRGGMDGFFATVLRTPSAAA